MSPAAITAQAPTLGIERDGEHLVLRMAGRLDSRTTERVWSQALRVLRRIAPRHLTIDAGGITYCDSTGIAMLLDLEQQQERRGGRIEIEGLPDEYQVLLDMFQLEHHDYPQTRVSPPVRGGVFEDIGQRTAYLVRDCATLLRYVGELVVALLAAVRHPGRVRWRDVGRTIQEAGVNGTPVVSLIGFLIGLIIAYQSAMILHRYGGDVFLADVVGLTMVRELGPLMTAVLLAARSGSAFAAELGTMKINEEIAALRTMGLDPVRFLVTTRVVAAVTVTPLLSAFAILAGVVGGAMVSVALLQLPLVTYVNRLLQAVSLTALLGGLAKTFVFGVVVAALGCIRGMQTRGGAAGVGGAATSAVVSSVVMIIVIDGVFSVIYYHLDI